MSGWKCKLGIHRYETVNPHGRAHRDAIVRGGRPMWLVWNVRCSMCGKTGYRERAL